MSGPEAREACLAAVSANVCDILPHCEVHDVFQDSIVKHMIAIIIEVYFLCHHHITKHFEALTCPLTRASINFPN